MKNTIAALGLAVAATVGLSSAVIAADYPQRPVTMILPWPPGDVDDQLLRVIADAFSQETGVPAKVVNRPGGFGIEGAQALASSRADGYTVANLLIDIPTSYIIQDVAPYKAEDFEVIGLFMNFPFVLAAPADAPYSTLAEMADYAKSNPVRFAHFGFETIPAQQTFEAARQLGFEFATETGYDITDCATLANGDADVMNATLGWVLPCLDELKVLAAYTEKPISLFPDAPLLRDQMQGPTFPLWSGLFVPAGTPQEVKDKIARIAEAAMKSEKAHEIAKQTGVEVYWLGAEESKARIAQDYAEIKALFEKMGK
ncbi:tripartite tricarboxylate transporter substrate binding protein [Marimonas lutisalis]|uniref:tripartite tricarboxylate transporter substrate binding protein n=1 Tax=Marimonas lutisalis TaxID=2545756 RepID=UPI0010FA00D0|nr:tripartite tricarboxylate transporter substrate binding protein [Marimonas lutisalis]